MKHTSSNKDKNANAANGNNPAIKRVFIESRNKMANYETKAHESSKHNGIKIKIKN